MRIKLKIPLLILIVFFIVAGIFVYIQWDNLLALKMGMGISQDDIQEKIHENQEVVSEALKDYPETSVRELTQEEQEALSEGDISEQDAIELVLGKKFFTGEKAEGWAALSKNGTSSGENSFGVGTGENKQTHSDSHEASVDDKVAELVARMYVLKSQFSGSVDAAVNSVIAQFDSLPSEKKTNAAKMACINSGISRLASLEGTCDARVSEVVSELRTLLKSNGRSTALADSIMSAYQNEKQLTKAYYINLYANH